jgi:hypothetical protein
MGLERIFYYHTLQCALNLYIENKFDFFLLFYNRRVPPTKKIYWLKFFFHFHPLCEIWCMIEVTMTIMWMNEDALNFILCLTVILHCQCEIKWIAFNEYHWKISHTLQYVIAFRKLSNESGVEREVSFLK